MGICRRRRKKPVFVRQRHVRLRPALLIREHEFMNKGIWLAVLLLAAGGGVTNIPAQEVAWRLGEPLPDPAVPGDSGAGADFQPPPPAPAPEPFPHMGSWVGDPLASFYTKCEYLLWWTRPDRVPVLVTTGPFTNPAVAPALLGEPGTVALFGGSTLDHNAQSGLRLTAGSWLDIWHEEGLEVSLFCLLPRSENFKANSAQTPVLARPFIPETAVPGLSPPEFAAISGKTLGTIDIRSPSSLFGVEPSYKCKACSDTDCQREYCVNWFCGARYVNFDERLTISENTVSLPGSGLAQSASIVKDRFATLNQFYGAQVGVEAEYQQGPWTINFKGKLAVGGTHEEINIAGTQAVFLPTGVVNNFMGGLLALPSNIGTLQRDRLAFMPEVGFDLGYLFTSQIRGFVGYDCLYWNRVARPGQQIDPVLDPTLIPNAVPSGTPPGRHDRPAALFRESDFWAQGLTVGLEFRY